MWLIDWLENEWFANEEMYSVGILFGDLLLVLLLQQPPPPHRAPPEHLLRVDLGCGLEDRVPVAAGYHQSCFDDSTAMMPWRLVRVKRPGVLLHESTHRVSRDKIVGAVGLGIGMVDEDHMEATIEVVVGLEAEGDSGVVREERWIVVVIVGEVLVLREWLHLLQRSMLATCSSMSPLRIFRGSLRLLGLSSLLSLLLMLEAWARGKFFFLYCPFSKISPFSTRHGQLIFFFFFNYRFGYVEFETIEEAKAAIEAKHQSVLEGRRLVVNYMNKTPRASRGEVSNPPSKTLFIGNLAFEMSDADLNKLFRDIRNVIDVRVAIDRRTGQPRGFAHADFIDIESATKGKEALVGKEVYGRQLRIDFSAGSREGRGDGGAPRDGGRDRF
jgi:hypothetical protein